MAEVECHWSSCGRPRGSVRAAESGQGGGTEADCRMGKLQKGFRFEPRRPCPVPLSLTPPVATAPVQRRVEAARQREIAEASHEEVHSLIHSAHLRRLVSSRPTRAPSCQIGPPVDAGPQTAGDTEQGRSSPGRARQAGAHCRRAGPPLPPVLITHCLLPVTAYTFHQPEPRIPPRGSFTGGSTRRRSWPPSS